jgi:HSP20 family molecular chaperone IbpA
MPPSTVLEEFPVGLRLFQDSVSRLFSEPSNRPWSPAVDIFETEHELVLKVDVPEIEMKDIDLQVENGTLTMKGERKFEQEQKGRATTGSSAATAPSCAPSRCPIAWMWTKSMPSTKAAS